MKKSNSNLSAETLIRVFNPKRSPRSFTNTHHHTLKRNYAIFRQHTHTLSAEKRTISIVFFFYSQQTRAHANRHTIAVGCDASLSVGKD